MGEQDHKRYERYNNGRHVHAPQKSRRQRHKIYINNRDNWGACDIDGGLMTEAIEGGDELKGHIS